MGPSVGVVTIRGSASDSGSSLTRDSRHARQRAELVLAEPLAKAHPRPPAERDVGAAGQRGLALGQEPVGVEAERIRIQLRQMVGGPGRVVNADLRGHRHPAEHDVTRGPPRPHPRRRIAPQRLLQRALEHRQGDAVELGPASGFAPERLIELVLDRLARRRGPPELVEQERERRRRRVVPGEQRSVTA